MKYGNLTKDTQCSRWEIIWNVFRILASFCILDIALPIFVFMALYGKSIFNLSEKGIQYFLAGSIILTSQRFMRAIAKVPAIGSKIHMLSKVIGVYGK